MIFSLFLIHVLIAGDVRRIRFSFDSEKFPYETVTRTEQISFSVPVGSRLRNGLLQIPPLTFGPSIVYEALIGKAPIPHLKFEDYSIVDHPPDPYDSSALDSELVD